MQLPIRTKRMPSFENFSVCRRRTLCFVSKVDLLRYDVSTFLALKFLAKVNFSIIAKVTDNVTKPFCLFHQALKRRNPSSYFLFF